MRSSDVVEILKLPVAERVRLIELIWESLVGDPAALALGDAHRLVLDERLAEHERNLDDIATRDELWCSRSFIWPVTRSCGPSRRRASHLVHRTRGIASPYFAGLFSVRR